MCAFVCLRPNTGSRKMETKGSCSRTKCQRDGRRWARRPSLTSRLGNLMQEPEEGLQTSQWKRAPAEVDNTVDPTPTDSKMIVREPVGVALGPPETEKQSFDGEA